MISKINYEMYNNFYSYNLNYLFKEQFSVGNLEDKSQEVI